ncbi:Uncharacterised protein [Mycobacterium tuberculosis]|nr:Uncharacterised protein [Mycobacterium tuberculosis]
MCCRSMRPLHLEVLCGHDDGDLLDSVVTE